MSNVKSDASKLPQSSDKAEIRKQVEFYFSDENLPTDKFLWKTSQANNGWVPIATIHSFKRMRRFQPEETVIEALKESEVLEVNEQNTEVRRKTPIKEPNPEEKKGAFQRSVYAKGFGTESETTQFDIEKFFGEFGETKQVRLRRAEDGTFKGSVFVEFAEMASSDKFLAAKPQYNGEDLLVMSKQAYTEMKAAEHGFSSNVNGKRRRFNAFKDKSKGQKGNQKGNQRGRNQRERGQKRQREDESNEESKKAKGDGEASGAESKPETETAPAPETVSRTESKTEVASEAASEAAPEAAPEAAAPAETN